MAAQTRLAWSHYYQIIHMPQKLLDRRPLILGQLIFFSNSSFYNSLGLLHKLHLGPEEIGQVLGGGAEMFLSLGGQRLLGEAKAVQFLLILRGQVTAVRLKVKEEKRKLP